MGWPSCYSERRPEGAPWGETRKIAAILVADIVGYSRLAGPDEDRTLSRPRGLRTDLIDLAVYRPFAARAHPRSRLDR
jgi:class 3 adenylate cyclase